MRHGEQRLQTDIASYLSWCLGDGVWFSAWPLGGGGELRGKILKGMGVKSGVPDIELIHNGIARFMEVKTKNGALSRAQRETIEKLVSAGACVAVVRSLDEVRHQLREWRVPTREAKPSGERIKQSLRVALASEGVAVAAPEAVASGRAGTRRL